MRRLALALVVALIASACAPAPAASPAPTSSPIALPSPSTEPPPTATPVATPTASPTASPSPTPRPTPSTAELVVEFWSRVRAQYPWMPDLRIRSDAVGAPAYYLGVENGFAVVTLQPGAALGSEGDVIWHESGHAAIDVASRLSATSANDIMTAYWTARGFPGTWQQQQQKADAARAAGVTGFALHQMLPNEMFADTFAAAMIEHYRDGDQFPSVPLDRAKLRVFFSAMPTFIPGGVNARALGALRGQWELVNRTGLPFDASGLARYPGLGEVWALPTSTGAPKLIATYVTSPDARLPDPNLLARQLSPDAKRLVLSVALPAVGGGWRYGLVVLELETGRTQIITSDPAFHDLHPAWSPDGTKIAFARRFDQAVAYDGGLWLVSSDGTGTRQLLETLPQGATVVYGWSADGALIGYDTVDQYGGYALFDVTRSTAAGRFESFVQAPAPASWRRARPAFVGAFSAQFDGTGTSLAVAESAGGALRVVAGPDAGFVLSRPRWSPVSADILYLRTLQGYTELYAVNATDGKAPQRIVTSTQPVLAAWSTSGAEVAYLAADDPLSASVRLLARDGTQERELARLTQPTASWRETYRDLISVAYP